MFHQEAELASRQWTHGLCPHWEYSLCHPKGSLSRLWAECRCESAVWALSRAVVMSSQLGKQSWSSQSWNGRSKPPHPESCWETSSGACCGHCVEMPCVIVVTLFQVLAGKPTKEDSYGTSSASRADRQWQSKNSWRHTRSNPLRNRCDGAAKLEHWHKPKVSVKNTHLQQMQGGSGGLNNNNNDTSPHHGKELLYTLSSDLKIVHHNPCYV